MRPIYWRLLGAFESLEITKGHNLMNSDGGPILLNCFHRVMK